MLAATLVAFATRVNASTPSNLGIAKFGALVVDPTTGRVFVSGDDKVVVLTADGSVITTLTGLSGAAGMSVDETSLWVAERDAGAISRFDLRSLAATGRFLTGVTMKGAVLSTANAVWFLAPEPQSNNGTLWRLDPDTGDVTRQDSGWQWSQLSKIPGTPTRLLAGMSIVDLTTNPATTIGGLGNPTDLAVTDHGTVVIANGWPYAFYEYSLTLERQTTPRTGVVYPGMYYPNGVAFSPAFGGIIAGTTDASGRLFVARDGIPVSTHEFRIPGDAAPAGVRLAEDGSRAYVVMKPADADAFSLVAFPLAAAISASSHDEVVAHADTRVVLKGPGLPGATAVRFGGVDTPFAPTEDGLEVEIDTDAPPGPTDLVIDTPFGQAHKSLDVVADRGAELRGTISLGKVPLVGTTVSLSGDEITSRTTIVDATGTYRFTNLPADGSFAISARLGTFQATKRPIELQANAVTTASIDFAKPPTATAEVRRRALPHGAVRDVASDPRTGRLFVAVGNEVDVFDDAGSPLARIPRQWGADGMAFADGLLYVNLLGSGTVSVIDPVTMTERTRLHTRAATTGTLAVAGGRVWVSDDDDQWVGAGAINPATDDYTHVEYPYMNYRTVFRNIEDDGDRFLTSTYGITSGSVQVMDATVVPPITLVDRTTGVIDGTSDPIGSSTKNRVWVQGGAEYRMSDLQLTGTTYPAGAGAGVAHSGGHGGLLMFGNKVSREGLACATHTLSATPVRRGVALDASGDTAYIAGDDGRLHTYDLHPQILGLTIDVTAQPPAIDVTGLGLACAKSVRIDGQAVTVSAGSTSITIASTGLSVGSHVISVETAWGTAVSTGFELSAAVGPTISGLPLTGAVGGGLVRIDGAALTGATAVTFGGVAVPFAVMSDSSILALAPAHVPGAVDVVVTTPRGVSSSATYRYVDPTAPGQPTVARVELDAVPNGSVPVVGDFDGNGVDDIFWYGTGRISDQRWLFAADGSHTTEAHVVRGDYRPVAGDFTGDGVDDIFWYAPGPDADYLWDYEPGGGRSITKRSVAGDLQPVVGDYTGDGVDEIFWYAPSTTPGGPLRPVAGDFTGDGVEDIFWHGPGSATDTLWNFTPRGTLVKTVIDVRGSYQPFAGDFTGDGVDDIFWFVPGPANDAMWDFEPGGGYTASRASRGDAALPAVGDFTGGGVDDVVWSTGGTTALWFFSPVVREAS